MVNMKARARKQQEMVDQWNNNICIGDDVFYSNDFGEEIQTRTRSKAQLLSGHTAVVWLEGMPDCRLLSRCRKI